MSEQRAGITDRWWAPILVLALGTFASGTDGLVIAGILPKVAADLRITTTVAGQMVTLFAFAYAIGSPILMALFAGGWQAKRLLALAILVFVLANLLAAIAPNVVVLAIARVLTALSAGVYVPTAAATASLMVDPSRRGRALAIVLGGASIATVAGVPLGAWIGAHLSWRMTFVFVSVIAVTALGGVLSRLSDGIRVPKVSLRVRITPLTRIDVVAAITVTLFANLAGFALYTYVGLIFQNVTWSASVSTLPILLLTFGLGSIAGSWLGGWGADQWGPSKTLLVALCIFTLDFSLLWLAQATLASSCAFMFIWGLAGWAFVTPQQYRLIRLAPDVPAIVLSLNASAMYLGVALGAALGGMVISSLGVAYLWILASVSGTSSVIVLIGQLLQERRLLHPLRS